MYRTWSAESDELTLVVMTLSSTYPYSLSCCFMVNHLLEYAIKPGRRTTSNAGCQKKIDGCVRCFLKQQVKFIWQLHVTSSTTYIKRKRQIETEEGLMFPSTAKIQPPLFLMSDLRLKNLFNSLLVRSSSSLARNGFSNDLFLGYA